MTSPPLGLDHERRLRELVTEAFRRTGVPGGIVQFVRADGPVLTVEYGELGANDPVMLGSTSKSLTATLLLQLAEEGMIDLNAPVVQYQPQAKVPRDVTISDLAHHCSGLATDATPRRMRLARSRRFHYANQNYNLLGQLIEAVLGLPFSAALQQRILTPLGMTDRANPGADAVHTAFRLPRAQSVGHVGVFGLPVPVRAFPAGADSWIQSPSGATYASAADAGRFLSMLLSGGVANGQRILSPAAVERMFHDVVPADGSPAVTGVLGETGEYGFGWVRKRFRDQWVHLHVGKVPGSTTVFVLLPALELGFALLVNIGDFLVRQPLVERLAENIIRILVGTHLLSVPNHWTRQALLNVTYAAILGGAAAGARAIPKRPAAQLAYHGLLPATLAFGVRKLSATPWPWLFRFVPDAAVVLGAAAGVSTITGMLELARSIGPAGKEAP